MDLNPALDYLERHFERFVQELSDYSCIPSIAFPGYPPETLEASAEWTARRLRQAGLTQVEILRLPGVPPYVYAEHCQVLGAPTLLLYAHHDVQPPGRPEKWLSPAFEPERRGDRLYGRGVVDDKAGALMQIAALEAYLQTLGRLPLNVKVLIEGEEEVGSGHLGQLLALHEDKLKADVMVLSDTANLEAGLPSLTYQLRGLVDAVVEVRTLDHPVHSGVWGGPAVGALQALQEILHRLWKPDGSIAIPGIYDDVPILKPEERQRLKELPWNEGAFRQDLGAVPSLEWGGEASYSLYERLWSRPALAILGIDAPRVAEVSNQVVEWARAKISLRIVHGMNPQKSRQQLCDFLAQNPPFGAEVAVHPGAAGSPWRQEPTGAAFAAAGRALERGYGRAVAHIGCGASIPFVEPLTRQFQIPALLIGLEDPICQAHGENESVLLSDWKSGMRAMVYLLAEKFR